MIYYKGFGVKYDELALDYKIVIAEQVEVVDRFSSLSYVFDWIDSLDLTGEL